MITSLAQQLRDAERERVQTFNEQHFDWLMLLQSHFTHAITLTFNPSKIRRLVNRESFTNINSKSMQLELQQKAFGCFVKRLDKLLYGNSSARFGQRLLLIPVMHGLYEGGKLHYHCAVGVPEDRFEVLGKKVIEAWQHTPLAGHQVDFKPYRDSGWLEYINKETKYINRENIDWINVRVPATLSSTVE